MVHEQIPSFYRGFRRDAHPMAIMVGVVGALSAFYHDSLDIHDPRQREIAAYRLLLRCRHFAAMVLQIFHQVFVHPRNDLDYASNFLHMMFSQYQQKHTRLTRFCPMPW